MMDIYLAPMELIYEATHWYGALFPPVWFQVEKEAHICLTKRLQRTLNAIYWRLYPLMS